VAEELARLEARESQVLHGIDERLQKAEVTEGEGDREKVQRDVEALKERLERIPKLAELEGGVEHARQNVLGCLRKKYVYPGVRRLVGRANVGVATRGRLIAGRKWRSLRSTRAAWRRRSW